MAIISPETIVLIFDDDNYESSTVVCKIPVGLNANGKPVFRTVKHTVPRKEGDQLSAVLLKMDKNAANLRDGLKPGPSTKKLSLVP